MPILYRCDCEDVATVVQINNLAWRLKHESAKGRFSQKQSSKRVEQCVTVNIVPSSVVNKTHRVGVLWL